MRGIVASALSPSASGSTGTSRHSSGSSPSARHASSIASRADSSRRKTIATPRLEASPAEPATPGPNHLGLPAGSGSSTPAPSPVFPSAAVAPRCRTLCSPSSRQSTISREARPWASATKPIPQASRSTNGPNCPVRPRCTTRSRCVATGSGRSHRAARRGGGRGARPAGGGDGRPRGSPGSSVRRRVGRSDVRDGPRRRGPTRALPAGARGDAPRGGARTGSSPGSRRGRLHGARISWRCLPVSGCAGVHEAFLSLAEK